VESGAGGGDGAVEVCGGSDVNVGCDGGFIVWRGDGEGFVGGGVDVLRVLVGEEE
jgi:hypothetical protein